MKNYFHICTFFLFTSVTYSQGNLFYYQEAKYYHIFGDKVNIRAAADKNSDVLMQVTIGDSIQVKSVTDVMLELNGMVYPWVEVEWIYNKQKKSGYIWGGLFSFYHENFQTESGRTYQLYLGPLRYDNDSEELLGEARLCADGQILDARSFQLHVFDRKAPCFTMGVYPQNYYTVRSEYRHIEHISSVSLTVESCGPTGDVYILMNDGKIIFSGSELGTFSGGDFREGNEFIFPWDKGGMKEKIFEYYSYFSEAYEDEPEKDTTYLIQTYSKQNGKFILDDK